MIAHRHTIKRQVDKATKTSSGSLIFYAKLTTIITLLVLMLGNIFIFTKSVHLSDNISLLEHDIVSLKKENEYLQKKIYAENSIVSLNYSAQQLGFTKQAEPVFFEKPNYAMAQ